nr:MAG TPA: hypothetical protein [Caudoviricetes sp.]
MKKNVLYLMEMGMNDNTIATDVKNHRVRVLENIDIIYRGEKYNMFFEFVHGVHRRYRTTTHGNTVEKIILKDGIYVDTQFEKLDGIWKDGTPHYSSWRKSDLEEEFYEEHHEYTKKDILEIVNRYKVGEKFTEVCLIETTTAEIIRKNGGYREKEILGDGKNFQVDGDSYFSIGDTWTEDHKTVRCNKEVWVPTKNGRKLEVVDFCEVDLVTGRITR